MTERVYGKIKDFVGEYEQSDDITMISVSVEKQPKNARRELRLRSETRFFSEVKAAITQSGLLSPKAGRRACLAAEEIFVNICSYAYDGGTGDVLFELEPAENGVVMRFTDSGKPFDPLKDIVNIDEYDMTAQEGGLGRFITFSIAESAEYCRSDNKNILILKIKKEE